MLIIARISYGINGSFGSPQKKFNINFTKASTKFCLSLHYNADNSYLFVNGKEIFKSKILTFQLKVFLMDLVILSLEEEYL